MSRDELSLIENMIMSCVYEVGHVRANDVLFGDIIYTSNKHVMVR